MKKQKNSSKNTTRKNKKSIKKYQTNRKIAIIISTCTVTILCVIAIAIALATRPAALSDIKTHYHSLSVGVSQANTGILYKFDFDNESQLAIDMYQKANGELDYKSQWYFLGKEKSIYYKFNTDLVPSAKMWGFDNEWTEDNSQEYEYEKTPAFCILQALEVIKNSKGEIISSDNDGTTFNLTDISEPENLFLYAESSLVEGGERYANNYDSIKAKVTLKNNGEVSKIIFQPGIVKKDNVINGFLETFSNDDYKEIVWDFFDFNSTEVNYKDDLWNLL